MSNIPKYSEELDLWGFLKKIVHAFVAIGKGISFMTKVTMERFMLFFCISLVGAGLGLGVYFMMKPVYITHIIIKSKFLNNDYCSQLINTLDDLADHKENAPILAEKLGISTKLAEQVKSIQFRNFSDKFEKLYKDSVAIDAPFKVEVKVHDTSVLDSLQKGIVAYLENNEFALKIKTVKVQNLELLKAKIKSELISLDTVKLLVNNSITPRATGNGIILGEPIDPVTVYQKAIEMYRNELNIQEAITLINNVELVENFTKFIKPSWPKWWLNTLIGGLTTYFLAMAWVVRRRKTE